MKDISPEYIKMCEKAEEIQNNYKPIQGDIFWHPTILTITMWNGDWKEEIAIWRDKGAIWLPRQDQLQEMIINFGRGHQNAGIFIGLSMFADNYNYNETSMEQLWLAFVMKEKYNKVWIDGDWKIENAPDPKIKFWDEEK